MKTRITALLPLLLGALHSGSASAQTAPSSGPGINAPGDAFDDRLPALDVGGLLRFNGQTWVVQDNLVFRTRFEKYLSTPEEAGEMEAAHRKILNEIIVLLDPNNLNKQTLSNAYRLLARASGFPGDSRLCDTLANGIYSIWQSRRNQAQLAEANNILREENERTRRNLASRAFSQGSTPGSRAADSLVQAARSETLVENAALRKANEVKSALSELQEKIQYQGLLVQFFVQRRFHHVIIGTRFYRALFSDGDAKLNLPESVQTPFARGSGLPPTVTTLESLANEAIREAQTNVQAFHRLYELDELRSATERIRDALIVGEFMPELRTLPFERKRKVLRFLQGTAALNSAMEIKDYTTALNLLDAPSGLAEIAKDFDAARPRAVIETARNASRIALAQARNAAVSGDLPAFETALKQAAAIWPNNPELQDAAAKSFDQGNLQSQALKELDQLISQKNLRRIAEEAGKFLAATQNAPDAKQQQLKSAMEDVKLIETALLSAQEMARQGNHAGAWETVNRVALQFPDDSKTQQSHALYTAKAADFVRTIRTAQEHEKRNQNATSLAWYLKALRLYPKSELAETASRKLQRELLSHPN